MGGLRGRCEERRVRLQLSAEDRIADAALAAPPRLGSVRVVALDGPSGAGKTVLAHAVLAELRSRDVVAELVQTDDFATWDEPFAWWPRLEHGVLTPLRRGEPGRYRRLDWSAGEPRPGAERIVAVPAVLVIEGVSSAREEIAAELSVAVWVAGPDAQRRLERAVLRDGEHDRPHLRRWQLLERDWFTSDGTPGRADVHVVAR